MARTCRNNVDYFPHTVKQKKKMFYIRASYGNNGYAVWYMILEKLGEANFHYLDLSDKVEKMFLSAEFKIDIDLLEEIINTLVELGEFDSELWKEKKIIYSQKFINNIADAYKKRNSDPITRIELISLLKNKGILLKNKSNFKEENVGSNSQRKEEYKKEEETILNLEDKNNSILDEILSSGIWKETMQKSFNLTAEEFEDFFLKFWSLNYKGHILEDTPKKQNEIKRHFSNTMKKEKNGKSDSKKSRLERFAGV